MRPLLLTISLLMSCGLGCEHKPGVTMSSPLSCSIEAPPETRSGELASITLTVLNAAEAPLEIGLSGRPAVRIIITTASGMPVWDSRAGQAVQDILEVRTLEPKDKLAFAVVWDGRDSLGNPVPTGKYLIRATVSLEPPLRAEAEPKEILVRP